MLFYIVKSLCGVQVQVGNETLEVLGELVFEVGVLVQLLASQRTQNREMLGGTEGLEFFEALFYMTQHQFWGQGLTWGF